MSVLPQNIRWSRLEVKTKGTPPVTLAEAKSFLNYSDSGQDALIQSLLIAAVAYIEDTARRPLREWTCEGTWACADSDVDILLPYPPLVSVDSISYVNDAGNETTLATDKYSWVKGQRGFFRIIEEPDDLGDSDLVERWKVTWTCGATLPEAPLIVAIKMLVTGWFVARMAGDKDKYMDGAVNALVAPYVAPPSRVGDV